MFVCAPRRSRVVCWGIGGGVLDGAAGESCGGSSWRCRLRRTFPECAPSGLSPFFFFKLGYEATSQQNFPESIPRPLTTSASAFSCSRIRLSRSSKCLATITSWGDKFVDEATLSKFVPKTLGNGLPAGRCCGGYVVEGCPSRCENRGRVIVGLGRPTISSSLSSGSGNLNGRAE